MNVKNTFKGDSFTYAFARINESLKAGYPLEAVTLAESIISDRLYSFVKHHEEQPTNAKKLPQKEKKAKHNTNFATLITKAKRFNTMSMPTNDKVPIDMFVALNEWRIQRNQCVHAAAKSEPGTETIPVQTFIDMAESAAIRGKELARLVCAWHRKVKQQS